jgi:hypothetical protein
MTLIYMLGKNKKDKYLHLTTLDKVSLKSNKIVERHGVRRDVFFTKLTSRCLLFKIFLFYTTNF